MKHIVLFLLLFAGIAATAQNVIRPKIECPNDIWVNSYNGVLFYQRTDISIPTRSLPLEASFYYNSSANTVNFGYGNGWSLGYEYRYIVDSLGIIVEQGDGRQDLYKRQGNGFTAPAGVFSTLAQTPAGGYSLTTKDGIVYTFADTASKCLTQIKDRNGNTLDFAYANGHLVSIADASGRAITLRWTDSLMTRLGTNFDDRAYQYAYDTLGNLTSVTNPMSHTVYYGYNRDNRICRFTDEAGYSTLVTYNDDGMAHRVKTDFSDKSIRYEQASQQTIIIDYLTDANNQFTTYRWDTLGRVVEKTGNCCGYTTRLSYDNDNNVIGSEDANGNLSTATYDSHGNMLSLTDPLGHTERFTYTAYNKIATYIDKGGNRYSFTYDSHGNLTEINGPTGVGLRMAYNDFGQPVTLTDALGHSATIGYDSYGNRISITNENGKTSTFTFSAAGLLLSSTTPMGETSRYAYDRLERLTSETDPLGHTTRYQYDPRGNITTIIDALNNPITLTYDALCQPLTVTDAMGHSLRYTYNARQKATQVVDAEGRTTRYRYDDRDRLTMIIDPNGDTTSYSYDGVGQLLATFFPNGRIVEYDYDALHRLTKVSDQYGVMEQNVYNALGNVVATISGCGDTTRYTYTSTRQIASIRDALGNTQHFTYDANGNRLTSTDATNQTITYTYDALDNELSETDEMGNTTSYTYDDNARLASVTDANGNATTYRYDANGNLAAITFANGKTKQSAYDGVGNTISEQDEGGNTITMAYDAIGRMTRRTYADGRSEQFTYNAMGDLLSAVNSDATVGFTYTAGGMLASETLNSKTTRYTYDIRRGTITITYPGGRTITEHYDLRNRLQYITEGSDTIARFTYDADNYIASRTYNNGTSSAYTFDGAHQLTRLIDGPGIIDHTMLYDADGNMTARIDNLNASKSETYGYNEAHKLITFKKGLAAGNQIASPTRHIQYALDALGNRTRVTDNGVATNYTHNSVNAYTAVGSQTYQYDERGNMTNDGRHTYQYDGNSNIVSVDNGSTATYKYDALGRRIAKTAAGATTKFYYSGHKLLEERNESDQLTASYIVGRGIDNVLQMTKNGNRYYYHRDHLGSIVAISNDAGSVVERYEYDPYGTPTILDSAGNTLQASAIGNRYMFSGREYDSETGLYYFRARTMYAALGRFMQADPYLYIDSYNYYTYVDNMPLRYIDASGNGFGESALNFLFGSCIDLKKEWGCNSALENGLNIAFCAMDIGETAFDIVEIAGALVAAPETGGVSLVGTIGLITLQKAGTKTLKRGIKKGVKKAAKKTLKKNAKKGNKALKKTNKNNDFCGFGGTMRVELFAQVGIVGKECQKGTHGAQKGPNSIIAAAEEYARAHEVGKKGERKNWLDLLGQINDILGL